MNEHTNAWTARLLKVFSVVLVAVLCVATPVALTGCGSSDVSSSDTTSEATTSDTEATTAQVTVTQKVGDGEERQLTVEKDASVLDVLKASGVSYQSQDSSYGEYVTAIDGTAADDTHGWSYTVNGEEPTVGAGDYQVADGDAIVWTYVEYTS